MKNKRFLDIAWNVEKIQKNSSFKFLFFFFGCFPNFSTDKSNYSNPNFVYTF